MFQSICFVSTSNTKKETNKSNNTTNKRNIKNDKESKSNIKNNKESKNDNKKWWLSDDLFLNLLITTLN